MEKLRHQNKDLSERLEVQKGLKDNLRDKIQNMEDICVDVTSKKNRALDERDKAINEVV